MTNYPDATGHFERFGGRFVPEALHAALDELTEAFRTANADPGFAAELHDLRINYAGRPSALTDEPTSTTSKTKPNTGSAGNSNATGNGFQLPGPQHKEL